MPRDGSHVVFGVQSIPARALRFPANFSVKTGDYDHGNRDAHAPGFRGA